MSDKIISWNCNGFNSHYTDFNLLCQKLNPIIINIQETKFKPNYKKDFIRNYKCFIKNFGDDGHRNAQGGVMTLIDKSYCATAVQLNT